MRGVFRAGRASGRLLPRVGIYRILVCRTVHTLGDSLTLTPLLEELGTVYPGAEVDIVTGCPSAQALYGAFPNVRSIFRLPTHVAGHPIGTLKALHAMRRLRYDLVIDPDPRSQSGRLLTLRAHATLSLGYAGPNKSGTLTHGVNAADVPRHRATTAVYLLRAALGEGSSAREYPPPSLRLSAEETERGRHTLARIAGAPDDRTPLRCIGLFANATRDKLLGREWWNRFLAAFEPRAADHRLIEVLPAGGRSLLDDRYPGFYCSDVRRMAAVLANLSLHISADCGVMHLAWASGAPTVGLFSVTDPVEWGPFGARSRSLDLRGTTPEQIAEMIAGMLPREPACSDAGWSPFRRSA